MNDAQKFLRKKQLVLVFTCNPRPQRICSLQYLVTCQTRLFTLLCV